MKLYQHQEKIIEQNPLWSGIWQGTGSGKTITALSLSEGKTMVICPKTIRDDKTWERNHNLLSGAKISQLDVISKEDFRLGKFDESVVYDTVIVDEADNFAGVLPNTKQKNYKPVINASQLFLKLRHYIRTKRPKRFYLLTATPVRSPMTVWAFNNLLKNNINFFTFRDRFYYQQTKGYRKFFIPVLTKQNKELLAKIIQDLGPTGKLEDFFDVPTQTYKTHFVEPTTEQIKRLKDIAIEYPDPLVLITKRHQIENGVLKGNEFAPSEEIKDNKIEAILKYADEFPKIVIFARYTEQIAKIKKALKSYNVFILSGQTKNRETVLSQANTAEEAIIIIQSQVSAGYELPSFPVMIFASQDYAVVNRIQAEGRILRANNLKKNLYITLVTTGGIDEEVKKCLDNKVDFNEAIFHNQMSEEARSTISSNT